MGRSCSAAAPVCQPVQCPSSDLSTGTGHPSGAGHGDYQCLGKQRNVFHTSYLQFNSTVYKVSVACDSEQLEHGM